MKQFDTLAKARRTAQHFLCAKCWANLLVLADKDSVRVVCSSDNTHDGFVPLGFVKRKIAEGRADRAEARINLSDSLGLENKYEKLTDEELLKSIGF